MLPQPYRLLSFEWEDITNEELARMLKEVVMSYFKLISQNFQETENNHT
jgi:hypothetical protein